MKTEEVLYAKDSGQKRRYRQLEDTENSHTTQLLIFILLLFNYRKLFVHLQLERVSCTKQVK